MGSAQPATLSSYPPHYPTQAYQNSQTQPPTYYQSYYYATTNQPQPSSIPQITYHPTVQQITYPTPSNANANQVRTETNTPPPPPLPQVQEPPQQPKNFPTHGTIITITGGSNTYFKTKRQRSDYYHQVNHVTIEDPITQSKWSHVPITFSYRDINLTSFPHTDVMVTTVYIDRWDVTKILINNGSQTEILFLATFNTMGFDRKQLREPSKSLYGFGGKRIKPAGTITLPMYFDTPKNPRTEYITFNVVDMPYPHNTIFGRGLLNTFEAALHSAYLCLKVPATFRVISIFSS
jgi:hypothetical protein